VLTNELDSWLSPIDLQVLENFGSIEIDDDETTPRFALFPEGDLLALIPRPTCFDEVAYLGPDSRWLVEVACRLAPGGDRAVELGAGQGYLSAALSNRYRFTLATDLRPWTAAVAAITLAMNMQPDGKAAVCAADVARGLRPRSFDLVTGNPPWVPNRDETRARRLFADGGPTGFELPRRFISEGSALIAPGGMGLFNCVDARYSGGREPLVELIRELELDGCVVEIEEVPADRQWPDRTKELGALYPDLERARLVSVVVKR
jgi:methylase of polypeptide subunit release factors